MAQAISSRAWFASHGVFSSILTAKVQDLSKNSMYHTRTKHIDVRYHLIREEVETESFHVKKIHTSENPAKMVTKTISKNKLKLYKELVGMSSL